MDDQSNLNVQKEKLDLVGRLNNILKDGVYIIATTGALALTRIPEYISKIPEKIGIEPNYLSSLDTTLMTFNTAAGITAVYTKRLGTSLGIYGATLIPELQDLCRGNTDDALNGFLAKTVVYGLGYALGAISKHVLKGVAHGTRDMHKSPNSN